MTEPSIKQFLRIARTFCAPSSWSDFQVGSVPAIRNSFSRLSFADHIVVLLRFSRRSWQVFFVVPAVLAHPHDDVRATMTQYSYGDVASGDGPCDKKSASHFKPARNSTDGQSKSSAPIGSFQDGTVGDAITVSSNEFVVRGQRPFH